VKSTTYTAHKHTGIGNDNPPGAGGNRFYNPVG
jgi:hypothetical protein